MGNSIKKHPSDDLLYSKRFKQNPTGQMEVTLTKENDHNVQYNYLHYLHIHLYEHNWSFPISKSLQMYFFQHLFYL